MNVKRSKIYRLMAEQNWTQTDLARRSGISRQWLSNVLRRGTCHPNTAFRIARALGAELEEIEAMEGEGLERVEK